MKHLSPAAWSARACIALVLALVVLAVGWRQVVGPADPTYPDAWDDRVLPLVEDVEELRGLDFEHPVHVDFVPVEEFKEEVRADEGDLTDQDRDELEDTVPLFRALGLLRGDLDLFELMQDLSSAGVLAYYSPETQRIRVRGTELTPPVTYTLVHELTHALQDQHFDLGTKLESFEDDDGNAAAVYRAVVEGDANRIATLWAGQLASEEQQTLQQELTEQAEQSRKDLAEIPGVLVTLMSAPYALGEPLATLVGAEDPETLDALFETPPTNDEVLLDPFVHDTPAADRVDVPQAEVPDGAEEIDAGEFGALSLYLVLAERLDIRAALAAADGWGGDHYATYRHDGTVCMDATVTGDSPTDTDELAGALAKWAAASPEAESRRDGDVVHLRTCDPGTDAEGGSDSSQDALTVVAARSSLGAMLAGQGAPRETAQCFGTAAVEEFTVEELTTTDPDEAADLQARMMAAMGSCQQRG